MKAAVAPRYGPPEVIRIKDVAKPVPKANQVLIRMRATTVTSGDVRLRKADPWIVRLFMGLTRPKTSILGSDLAGEVEAIGKDVTRFKVGDPVFGGGPSTHAEYVCVKEDGLRAPKPANMTFEEAAAVPFGALSALHFLRKANVRPGQKVLIYGASGAVGTYAVQLAKHFGAEVTGVCGTANLDLVRSLGADRVIDYTKEDFARPLTYDVVFHTVGKISFLRSLRALKKGGVYASDLMLAPFLRKLWGAVAGGKKVIGGIANPKVEDLVFLRDLIEAGKLRAIIDKRYPLDEIVEAHRYVERGHKKGNVVVVMAPKGA